MITPARWPQFQMSLVCGSAWSYGLKMRMRQNVYSYLVSWNEKQMLLKVKKNLGGAFMLKLFWKLLHDVQATGLYCVSVCAVCMCVSVQTCLRQVINRCNRVTLSLAWKPLCSVKPDSFQRGQSPAAEQRQSLNSPPLNSINSFEGNSSHTAKEIVVISNVSKNINNNKMTSHIISQLLHSVSSLSLSLCSRYEEAVEQLPLGHQANGAGLQVQWAQAAWSHR